MVKSHNVEENNILGKNPTHKGKIFYGTLFLLAIIISVLSLGVNTNLITEGENNGSGGIDINSNLNIISQPVSSADPINCRVYIDSLSKLEVYHGESIILQGHVEESNDTHPWFPSVNRQVVLVANNVRNNSASVYTNALGLFSITFFAEMNWDVWVNVTIQANTTSSELNTVVQNYIELDVDAVIDIKISNYMEPQFSYTTNPGMENYYIEGRVYDTSGNPYSGPGFLVDFYFDGSYEHKQIWVNGFDGYFWFSCWLRSNYTYYTISYAGDDDLGGGTFNFNFNKLDGIIFEFDEFPEIGYIDDYDWPWMTGRVISSTNASFTIPYSEFFMEFNGQDYYFSTNEEGIFYLSYQILNGSEVSGEQDMRFYMSHYTHDWNWLDYENQSAFETIRTIEIREPSLFEGPNSINQNMVWIVLGSVIGIVSIFILQKWRLKVVDEKDKKRTIGQVLEKFKNIRALLDAGRIKEACAYLYIIFSEISETKYGRDKKLSQSLRGFAIMMVKEYGSNPMTIYPFVQEIEKVIYGGIIPDTNVYLSIEKKFSKLYLELMGAQMPDY